MTVSVVNGHIEGRVALTGSDVLTEDTFSANLKPMGAGVWKMDFKCKKVNVTGTGLFKNGKFTGDYRYKKLLRKDHGKWIIEKNESIEEVKIENIPIEQEQEVGDSWIKIADDNSSTMYYSPQSIVRTNEAVKVWIRITFRGEARINHVQSVRSSGYSIKNYNQYSYTLNLQEYDCVRKRVKPVFAIDYDINRKALNTLKKDSPSDWEDVIPESIGESIFNKVCTK